MGHKYTFIVGESNSIFLKIIMEGKEPGVYSIITLRVFVLSGRSRGQSSSPARDKDFVVFLGS
jgi:hypothetical protein